jgi:hypothetical protein
MLGKHDSTFICTARVIAIAGRHMDLFRAKYVLDVGPPNCLREAKDFHKYNVSTTLDRML